MQSSFSQSRVWQLTALVCLIILGLVLEYFEVLDLHGIMEWFRGFSQTWWLPFVLILLQIILFMFALPGSAVLWIVAPIYEPLSATVILVAGSTLGGLAAYWFAHQARLSSLQYVRRHSLFVFIKKHADFFSLLGLRVFPGFPQSVVNYGASLLKLPLRAFVASAILGVGFKSYLYTNVIYNAVNAFDSPDLGRLEIVMPLLLIVLFLFAAKFIWFKKHQS